LNESLWLLAVCSLRVVTNGNGGALPGFGDQRNLELLVEAGFTPDEAIRIYTLNGAEYLGKRTRLVRLQWARLPILLSLKVTFHSNCRCREVKYVFKSGVGYDSQKLIESVRGLVGSTDRQSAHNERFHAARLRQRA